MSFLVIRIRIMLELNRIEYMKIRIILMKTILLH
nr:MAG TPA: hypothetical protein [Caudoviricetes sp.]